MIISDANHQPYVLWINGKMYGYHLGTVLSEAKAIVEQKWPHHEQPDCLMQLWRSGKIEWLYDGSKWSECCSRCLTIIRPEGGHMCGTCGRNI